jgi:hypothetical protein
VTSTISFAGNTIADPMIVQFALVPYAAFLATRFAKSQIMTTAVLNRLEETVDNRDLGVPLEIFPMNWDIVRDWERKAGLRGNRRPFAYTVPVVMAALILVALIVNLADANTENIKWALLSTVATLAMGIATVLGAKSWHVSFLGERGA